MRAILTYHSIDRSGSVVSLPPERFAEQVRWLARSGVRVATVEAVAAADDDVDAVALTFDDGFANFAAYAWPLLRDHGFPATVFIVTDHVGGTNAWRGVPEPGIPALPLLDWDTLGRLADEGLTLGVHTRTHPDLTTLDDGALEDELWGAAEIIEARTGRAATTAAYPYGAVDDAVVHAAAARFHAACTTEFRTLRGREAPHRLPRLDSYYFRRPGTLEAWGSTRFRAYVWARGRARRIRRRLLAAGGTP